MEPSRKNKICIQQQQIPSTSTHPSATKPTNQTSTLTGAPRDPPVLDHRAEGPLLHGPVARDQRVPHRADHVDVARSQLVHAGRFGRGPADPRGRAVRAGKADRRGDGGLPPGVPRSFRVSDDEVAASFLRG